MIQRDDSESRVKFRRTRDESRITCHDRRPYAIDADDSSTASLEETNRNVGSRFNFSAGIGQEAKDFSRAKEKREEKNVRTYGG